MAQCSVYNFIKGNLPYIGFGPRRAKSISAAQNFKTSSANVVQVSSAGLMYPLPLWVLARNFRSVLVSQTSSIFSREDLNEILFVFLITFLNSSCISYLSTKYRPKNFRVSISSISERSPCSRRGSVYHIRNGQKRTSH